MANNNIINIYLPDAPSTAIRVLGQTVTPSGKKNIDVSPSANIDGPVKAQTQSFENLTFQIQGIHYTTDANTITYENVLTLYRHKFNNTNPAYLEVTYGDTKTLKGSDGTTTKIPVVLETFNFPISVTESKNGYMPVGSLTFKETGTD